MKNHLLLFFVLISYFSFSQQKTFTIAWEGTKTLETSKSKIEVPAFNKENFNFDYGTGLTFFAQWEINITQ